MKRFDDMPFTHRVIIRCLFNGLLYGTLGFLVGSWLRLKGDQ